MKMEKFKEDKMWKRELIKNKLYALALILLGVVPILIDKDGTFFVFTLIIGIQLFFAKENWIMDGGCDNSDGEESRGKSVRSVSNRSRKEGYEYRNPETACRVR